MTNVFLIFAPLLGLVIGSFLNCLIWRLYEGESMLGRSHCRSCKKTISWYDNLPVLSYLFLQGKCRNCKKSIAWQYPVVEAVTALLFWLIIWRLIGRFGTVELWQLNSWLILLRDWFLASVLVVIFVMDLRWYVVLDQISLPAAIVVLAINLILGTGWQGLIISATIGIGFFLVQFVISRGRWLGGGDIRLGLILGVAFSWPHVLLAIFLAYIFGALVAIGLIIFGKKHWGEKIPLGTFLSAAAIVTMLYGEEIVNWYLKLII